MLDIELCYGLLEILRWVIVAIPRSEEDSVFYARQEGAHDIPAHSVAVPVLQLTEVDRLKPHACLRVRVLLKEPDKRVLLHLCYRVAFDETEYGEHQ